MATSVTVMMENGQRQARRLTGRVADIVVWLVERAELLTSSQKGKIQIDYAGEDLIIRGEDVTERKRK